MPENQPDYRSKRSHRDFLLPLQEALAYRDLVSRNNPFLTPSQTSNEKQGEKQAAISLLLSSFEQYLLNHLPHTYSVNPAEILAWFDDLPFEFLPHKRHGNPILTFNPVLAPDDVQGERDRKKYFPPVPLEGDAEKGAKRTVMLHEKPFPIINTFEVSDPFYQHS